MPFQEGDAISFYYTGDYVFQSLTGVVLGEDKNTFLSLMVRALPNSGFSGKVSFALYDYLQELLKSDSYREYGTLSNLMSYFSESYLKNYNSSAVSVLCAGKYTVNGTKRPILNKEKAIKILEWWSENFDMRRLYCLGLTFSEIDSTEMSPYKLYKELEKNPYAVPSVPIEKCSDLDFRLQRQRNRYDLAFGTFVREIYRNTVNKGWSCTPISLATSKVNFEFTQENREILSTEFRVIFEKVPIYPEDDKGKGSNDDTEEVVYLKNFYKACATVYDFICERVTSEPYANLGQPLFSDNALDEYQRSAVAMAMKENICIVCGPAGSGKTRTLRTIIHNLELQERTTIVTSFTGKAVVRAKQLNGIGENAATIHRILYGKGPQEFDDVIFEEASMISTPLLAKFIKKYKGRKYKAIFVGDPNQLPPIEWGFVFASMIASRSIPKVELKSIHRVITKDGTKDGIIANTTKLCTWPYKTDFLYEKTDNFQVIHGNVDRVFEYVEKVKALGGSPRDVTILSPYKARNIGGERYEHIMKINQICQFIWNRDNPSQIGPEQDPRLWRVGDRVMVNKNVYDGIDIFNGQEGIIIEVGEEGLHVAFDMEIIEKIDNVVMPVDQSRNENVKLVVVNEEELDSKNKKVLYSKIVHVPFPGRTQHKKRTLKVNGRDDDSESSLSTKLLDLSFAMTVHKSQGSEWKRVVVITPADAPIGGNFLNRNMYYTAYTRASEELIIVDASMKTPSILAKQLQHRHESLTNKLKHTLDRLHDYVERKVEVVDIGYCEELDDIDFL
jgi:hypothetical protein